MKKKTFKGFTLIELVVVIAIIGVLAAILVPSMLNYVHKARLRSANTNAKTAYNAVADYVTEQEVKGFSRAQVASEYGDQVIDCTGDKPDIPAQKEVFDALAHNGITSGQVFVGTDEINGRQNVYFVQWSGDADPEADNAIFGQYPNPISWETWQEDSIAWCTFFDPTDP